MKSKFKPIEVKSLKEACRHHLEHMIFSGELESGERLPSERRLAETLGVGRPVLHQVLVELEAKGLVSIVPRRGIFINDYRQSGSIAMLASFLSYNRDDLNVKFLGNLLDFRKLLEVENACLAANNRTEAHLQVLNQIYEKEVLAKREDAEYRTELDFSFHMQVAYASKNLVYPLIMNSFREVYTSFTSRFFEFYLESEIIDEVHQYHASLINDIKRKDERQAGITMIEMLEHGAQHLLEVPYGNHPS